ncbi:MAG: discoidin domain-containing protein, partial [Hymenobacter sp.]|nr:discoidin domain-containing protein [Hymenobacter sp.]
SNQGLGHVTYFGAQEKYVHGIVYLPVNPGLSYLARDTAWARREYGDLLRESREAQGYASELDFGEDDWSHVALGFKYMSDPKYVTRLLAENFRLAPTDPRYIVDEKEVSGLTYFYAHAQQNLGFFSTRFHTDFPTSSTFERNGRFTQAVAYNPSASARTCTVYDAGGAVVASALIPARTLLTFPSASSPPTPPTPPTACTAQPAIGATASTNPALARNAVDGDPNSRWESTFADPQQLTIDYGRAVAMSSVTIVWERASAKDYRLLGSADGTTWQELAARTNLPASTDAAADFRRTDVLPVTGSYRYLRMAGTARATVWGYSIFELTTCGNTAATPPTACTTQPATGATASTNSPLARNAVDGNPATRWESAFADPQELTVDYGRVTPMQTVTIVWERASAKDYRLLGSVDGTTWQELAARTNLPASTDAAGDFRRTDVLPVAGSYRYLRMAGTARTTVWGYSIFELTTCGGAATRTTLAVAGGAGVKQGSTTPLTVWPNPARSGVRIAGAGPGQTVQVLDAQGRVVAQRTARTDAPVELALPADLARGLYLVRCGGKSCRLVLE